MDFRLRFKLNIIWSLLSHGVAGGGACSAQAGAAGYKLLYGMPSSMGQDAGSNWGRRVGLLVKQPTPYVNATIAGDEDSDFLWASGRWLEYMLPVQDGHTVVAVPYGYSSASADDSADLLNQRLLAHAYLRMRQLNSEPRSQTPMNCHHHLKQLAEWLVAVLSAPQGRIAAHI